MAKTPTTTKTKTEVKTKAERGPSPQATERAAKRAKLEREFGVDSGTCLSGSGVTPRKGLFGPGGDAKLKSRLLTEFRSGNAKVRAKAVKQAEALGWGRFLTDAPVKAARGPKVALAPAEAVLTPEGEQAAAEAEG